MINMATEKEGDEKHLSFREKMAKCDEIENVPARNERKIKIIEEELISVKKSVHPKKDFLDDIKEYAEPKFNALSVRMGNVETLMTNMDTKMTNMDKRITNMEETVIKGFEDLRKGQSKISKEPEESLYK